MIAETVSVYGLSTGLFNGVVITGSPQVIALQLSPDQRYWPGVVDPARYRVDLVPDDFGATFPVLRRRQPLDTSEVEFVWTESANDWTPRPTAAVRMEEMRRLRNDYLAGTDTEVLVALEKLIVDVSKVLGAPVPSRILALVNYRQRMRDVTKTAKFSALDAGVIVPPPVPEN